jgi:hypothetical protein
MAFFRGSWMIIAVVQANEVEHLKRRVLRPFVERLDLLLVRFYEVRRRG